MNFVHKATTEHANEELKKGNEEKKNLSCALWAAIVLPTVDGAATKKAAIALKVGYSSCSHCFREHQARNGGWGRGYL